MTPARTPARARPLGPPFHVAEFFAGIGLMRMGLEGGGPFQVVWANDIEQSKAYMYRAHFRDPVEHFRLDDVRHVHGEHLYQPLDLATASFPCTDLSLAGGRRGLDGSESSMFWQFHRVIGELDGMGVPVPAVLLENVVGFALSRGGADLEAAIAALNDLGYVCDLVLLDARWWVPQSRPRLFVVGALQPRWTDAGWEPSRVRPEWLGRWVAERPHLKLATRPLPEPPRHGGCLAEVVDRLHYTDSRWWEPARLEAFVGSLSPVQRRRLTRLGDGQRLDWRTAYRRTRRGRAVWEIRDDPIAGCLRTPRGGSSRQAVVEAGRKHVRVRWMTPREYARLQGAPDYLLGGARDNEVRSGFGDAVCVPAVGWLAEHHLTPTLAGR